MRFAVVAAAMFLAGCASTAVIKGTELARVKSVHGVEVSLHSDQWVCPQGWQRSLWEQSDAKWQGCWKLNDGIVHIQWEDGDRHHVDAKAFFKEST